MANLAALQTLLKLRGPQDMSPTGDSFLDKRRSQIVSGEDAAFAPSELEQRITQRQLGDQGYGVSRDMVADAGIDAGRKAEQSAHDAAMEKLRQLVIPEQVKGAASIQAAHENAAAANSRAQASETAARERAQMQIGASNSRQQAGFDQADKARADTQKFKSGQVGQGDLAIAHERDALAARVAKTQPGNIMSFFGQKNPQGTELSDFDAALKATKDIVQNHPEAQSAEEGLQAIGALNERTPEQIAQVQKFMLLLRGH